MGQQNYCLGDTMKLKDDPRMTYCGVPNWPPLWCRAREQTMKGEIGILVSADCDRSGSKCYLAMELDGRRYAGTLLFNDVTFCWLITRIFKNRLGTPIKDLGELELSLSL